MKKDVIYIDIEDDITAIIERVKESPSKIIALVPPKRVTVLQSVVNLKLLQRAAQAADKRLVLITNDQPLAHLAAGTRMPVAKNLQSKPEIPQIAALEVDGDDIINGNELPIGEFAGASDDVAATETADGHAAKAAASKAASATPMAATKPQAVTPSSAQKAKPSRDTTVPNYERFRKKLFIGLALVAVLAGGLYWAFWIAPRAEISITAKTTAYAVDQPVTLKAGVTVDAKTSTIPVTVQSVQKTNSLDFEATGKKDVGEKAKGSIMVSNCDTSYSQEIVAGTLISSGGMNFLVDSNISVPGATFSNGGTTCQPGVSAPGGVTAQNIGESHNLPAGTKFSVAGASSKVTATAGSAFTGGTKSTVTVVSQDDVNRAKTQAAAQGGDTAKTELASAIGKDALLIDDSFKSDVKDPVVRPAVGEEAKRFSVTVETTYTMAGVARTDIDQYLTDQLNDHTKDNDKQKIYDTGSKSARFANFVTKDASTFGATIKAQGSIGPRIDDKTAASQAVGKRSGEIQQQLQSIEGVDSVSVKFTPPWVLTAPGADKITVKFLVKNAPGS